MENNKLDAWGDHVEEYSKRQKQLHQDLINKHLMEQELKNTTSEKTNMTNDDNTIQTQPDLIWFERKSNNITWTETKRWVAAVGILLLIFGLMGILYKYNVLLYTIFLLASIWVVGFLLVWVKDIVDELID